MEGFSMKIDKDDIQEFAEILSEAESFRPIVDLAVDAIISFGPEIKKFVDAFSRGLVSNRIASVEQYVAAGFSRDDAIIMTLDDVFSVRKMTDKMNNSVSRRRS
jgi:hypothetical protein